MSKLVRKAKYNLLWNTHTNTYICAYVYVSYTYIRINTQKLNLVIYANNKYK